jgi:hypothetical protein
MGFERQLAKRVTQNFTNPVSRAIRHVTTLSGSCRARGQAELDARGPRIAGARDHAMHNRAGLLARDVIASFLKAGAKVVR